MFPRHPAVSSLLLLILLPQIRSETVSLPAVPTDACAGQNGGGTATFSSSWPSNTHYQFSIYSKSKGGFASQKGAIWKIWTDTTGVEIRSLSVPGSGATNSGNAGVKPESGNLDIDYKSELEDLLKISNGNQFFSMNVTDSVLWDQHILVQLEESDGSIPVRRNRIIQARASSSNAEEVLKAALSTYTGPSKSATTKTKSADFGKAEVSRVTSKTPATKAPLATKVDAKAAVSNTLYAIHATATWPCSLGAGMGSIPPTGTAASPQVSSVCAANAVPLNSEAWATYGVSSYLSHLIASATATASDVTLVGYPTATIAVKNPAVDIGALLQADLELTSHCSITGLCQNVTCPGVRSGLTTEEELNPARYLAYISYVNISNLLYDFLNALQSYALSSSSALEASFVTTFYENTKVKVPWWSYTATVTPFLSGTATIAGFISLALGPEAGAVLAILQGIALSAFLISSIIGETAGQAALKAASANAQNEPLFIEAGKMGESMVTYVHNMTRVVKDAYFALLSNTTADRWTNITKSGVALQPFVYQDAWTDYITGNVTAALYMQNINWLYTEQESFIIWTPYNVPLAVYSAYKDGSLRPQYNFPSFSEKDCKDNFQGGDNGTIFTVCTGAGNKTPGMARFYQLKPKHRYTTAPQGWDSAFPIPGWKFNLPDVIRGSVNSWQFGGFNYNVTGTTIEKLSPTALVEDFTANATSPGHFNIPVCAPWIATYSKAKPGVNVVNFPDATTSWKGYWKSSWNQCFTGGAYGKTNSTEIYRSADSFSKIIPPEMAIAMYISDKDQIKFLVENEHTQLISTMPAGVPAMASALAADPYQKKKNNDGYGK